MRTVCHALLLILVGACRFGFESADFSDASTGTTGDASLPVDGLVRGDAPPASGIWGPPQPMEGLNDGNDHDDPTLTGDLLELYFNSDRPGGLGRADIWMSRRTAAGDPWGPPVLVDELSSPDAETTPEVSADGLIMVFASDRLGDRDLFMATRTDRTMDWSDPTPIAELNSANRESAGGFTGSGTHIVFSSDRDAADGDIYIATRSDSAAPWQPPAPLTEINTTGSERSAFLDESGLAFYMDADPDGDDNFDLYVATRSSLTEPFSPPARIDELATGEYDGDPWVSADGRYMAFTRYDGSVGILVETTRDQ